MRDLLVALGDALTGCPARCFGFLIPLSALGGNQSDTDARPSLLLTTSQSEGRWLRIAETTRWDVADRSACTAADESMVVAADVSVVEPRNEPRHSPARSITMGWMTARDRQSECASSPQHRNELRQWAWVKALSEG